MRISAKTRYGLASVISMAQHNNCEYITIISIAKKLGISKIYLEQVFSLLKKANIVKSAKGSQGGYQLASHPNDISVFQIFSAIDTMLFEKTESTVKENANDMEQAMNNAVFEKLDKAIVDTLKNITLYDLAIEIENYNETGYYMYNI